MTKSQDLAKALEQVQAQLAELSRRFELLEAATVKAPPAAANGTSAAPVEKAAPPPEPEKPSITEEELLAISAALGAYLGVRIRIKHIRLLSSRVWAQEGRVSIQASHRLHN